MPPVPVQNRARAHTSLPPLFLIQERTIPYFKDTIVPDSIEKRKSVLISSSENAIRGLLMNLCDIPLDKIHTLEIPTGLPMVYDPRTRRIRLLDDGLPEPLLERYDFGASPEMLLKPANKRIAPFKRREEKGHGSASDAVVAAAGASRGGDEDEEDDDDDDGPFYDPVIRVADSKVLEHLAAVHPYRLRVGHQQTASGAAAPVAAGAGAAPGGAAGDAAADDVFVHSLVN